MILNRKYFLFGCITLILGISTFGIANAYLPDTYPRFGYNSESNICQEKQFAENSPVNENLKGNYDNIRQCRISNPQVIFNTGLGIIIWFFLICLIFLLHFFIYPLLRKSTMVEKMVFTTFDIIILFILMFFVFLLQHYFSVPLGYYLYQSDIDNIIYMTLIRPQIPIYFAIAYIIFSFLRGIVISKKLRNN